MPATLQSQAVGYANGVISLIQQLAAIDSLIAELNSQNTELNFSAILGSFPTCAVNPDGSLGVADPVPSPDNPMDWRTPAASGLSRTITAYQIGVALTILQQVQALLSAGTPTQQQAAPNIVATCVGGET